MIYEAIPGWLGRAILSVLEKGAGHKYVRRVPTGNPKRPWRYFYKVTGGQHLGHDSEIQEGAAFKVRDGDREGHFHIHKVEGDQVHLYHDESGRTTKMSRSALRQMLHQEHAEAIAHERKRAETSHANARSKLIHSKTKAAKEKLEAHFGGTKSAEQKPSGAVATAKRSSGMAKTKATKVPQSEPPKTGAAEAQQKVLAAFKAAGARHYLSDLRQASGLSRKDFEGAIKALERDGKIDTMTLDNPRDRTPERLREAVDGQHIAYIRSSSKAAATKTEPTKDFHADVLEAARSAKQHMEGRVLISDAHKEMQRRGSKMSLEEFKQGILEAHRAGKISLAKHDMPQTLDAKDAKDSRIEDRGGTLMMIDHRGTEPSREPKKAAETKADNTKSPPPEVIDRLKSEISVINDSAKHLAAYKRMGARYEAEVAAKKAKGLADALKMIEEFRKRAPKNGVDAEKHLKDLGFERPTLSPAAHRWLSDMAESGQEGAADAMKIFGPAPLEKALSDDQAHALTKALVTTLDQHGVQAARQAIQDAKTPPAPQMGGFADFER